MLEQVYKSTGKKPKELEEMGTVPIEISHVLHYFLQISKSRQIGPSGPQPLLYSEIESYIRMFKPVLTQRDIEAIKACDIAFINETNNRKVNN